MIPRYDIDYDSYTTETDGEWCRYEDAERENAVLRRQLTGFLEGMPTSTQLRMISTLSLTNNIDVEFGAFQEAQKTVGRWLLRVAQTDIEREGIQEEGE